MTRIAFALAVLACLVSILQPPLSAQDNADEEVGIKPFGSYQWGDVDRINLMNGTLGATIPLVSYPQRGGVLHLRMPVNS